MLFFNFVSCNEKINLQKNRIISKNFYTLRKLLPRRFMDLFDSDNVGTSQSYGGLQMEQLLPLPLFLFRP